MHLSLLELEPPTTSLLVALLLLGALAFFVARRWPRTAYLCCGLVLVAAWFSTGSSAGLLFAPVSRDARPAVLAQFAVSGAFVVIAVGLPLVGAHRGRWSASRPAS